MVSREVPPAGLRSAPPAAARKGGDRAEGRATAVLLAAIWIVVAAGAFAAGADYYLAPLEERAYLESHALFAPTGTVGHSLGIAGSLMIAVGVGLYSLRKRLSLLARWGKLRTWLQVHIFLCTLGPYLVLLHTSFKFGGIVSIAFWSMAIVVVSGVFGRYVYVRIPKALNGQFQSLERIRQQRDELARGIRESWSIAPAAIEAMLGARRPPAGLVPALAFAIGSDLRRRTRARGVQRMLAARGVPAGQRESLTALIREHTRVEQQIVLLAPFQRLFRYWHTIHLPLAIVMFVILVVHVAVAILFGYGWPF